MHLFRDTVGGVKLFAGCSDAFLREVVLNLEPQVCIPGEYIVNKNDVARAMFFITRGEVEVLDGFDGKHLAFLSAPQYFGETAQELPAGHKRFDLHVPMTHLRRGRLQGANS